MSLQQISDQDLVKLYIGGEETVIEELLRRHKTKIFTSIYLLVKDQYLAGTCGDQKKHPLRRQRGLYREPRRIPQRAFACGLSGV